MTNGKYSYNQIAKALGCRRETVADIVKFRKIKANPDPNKGHAVAISPKGLAEIQRVLKVSRAPA